MASSNRFKRIGDFLEEISDQEIEAGCFFLESNNIKNNDEFHIDGEIINVKTNDWQYRKKGERYYKLELQQCAPNANKGKSKSEKNKSKSNAPLQISGYGVTYGVVLINERLRDKAPLARAFKAAMHHSCQNADNLVKANRRWGCDVHSVLFLEDRSWVDEETGEAYPESVFIEANKKAGNR